MTSAPSMPIARPLIRTETCQRCKWSTVVPQGGYQCRRYPPTLAFLPNGHGGIALATDYPPVLADAWCGEFASRIEVAS